ncbi:nitroreductase family deazaflavin-dependent oxidoreductase [Ktedonospora formicarum]|uniref:Nitroreductase family deazaflavin-dependent oxidoreductase n=1 Tax=Ktedonospora formicarum TaxID=2778364 RepID=A0A8J3MSP4_9CHLR|nr:nitroreductase family deazaflavin-dependent oxidoreductase [Ktedonospora formicarum]GHO47292.1 hypothetical protein KSX_54550 [Ktedonospora formicarum]
MEEPFHPPLRQRLFSAFLRALNRVGIAVGPFSFLTVQGRKTRKSYTLPVTPIKQQGVLFVISPFGEVSWVRNARAAGVVSLSRGRWHERLAVHELSPQESAPLLKTYLTRFLPFVRSSFAVTPQSNLAEFAAEAPRHPVFQLTQEPD